MTFFKRWNNIVGWAVFAIAAAVYLMTMEPVSSLWDCSEFIATSYKLEVGHPPGAPLFMMLARLATLFAFGNPDYVGVAVNAMNSIASAFCILFLFWTITHLARRLVTRGGGELTQANTLAVLGAGIVGALAYTFTDTFWFSAIEGEVYALSSMFTALVVWLMLKWEEEADEPHSSRWIVLIAYMMGLSIGVHILNLLTIPALVFIYYFRKTEKVTFKGTVYATLIAGAILLFINNIIIPYTVYVGALVDLFFVNTLGLPVNSGIVLFALALILGCGWAAWYTHRKGKVVWNIILLSTTMVLVGFSSYASVTIRAAANPPMNSNNPNNPHALLSMLNRDQYGDRPLLLGAYYSAPPEGYKEKSFYYLDEDGKYKPASVITGYTHSPEFVHFFPRMWDARKGEKEYKQWGAYRTRTDVMRDDKGEILRDEQGRPVRGEVVDFGRKKLYNDGYEDRTIIEPTFAENLNFFFNYQLSYMYWRYFLWNFVGRQSDIQPTRTQITDGNWLSGIKWIDEKFLGPQDDLPREIAENKGRNTYYFLPFLLGLIGLLHQLNRDERNFSIVLWLFIMTGIALVFYFNTSPGEPRERDYAYAGSFYAFAIWIGMGVAGLVRLLQDYAKMKELPAAAIVSVACLFVPVQMASQTWDDHDRSDRYMARDFGQNYLMSLQESGNPIIYTNGDNDTFPLWYNQETEGFRTDARTCNLSYLQTDWYIDQMKRPAYDSPSLPITWDRMEYVEGTNEYVPIQPEYKKSIDQLYAEAEKQALDGNPEALVNVKKEFGDNPYELKNILKNWVRNKNQDLKVIPTDSIVIKVDKEAVRRSGMMIPGDSIPDYMHISLKGKRALYKSELMMLEMLSEANWERPIYIAVSVGRENQLNMENHFVQEGLAYRFTPFDTSKTGVTIDSEKMYDNLMNKFKFGGIDKPGIYIDENAMRMCHSHRRIFSQLVQQLMREGKKDKAKAALDYAEKMIPAYNVPYDWQNGAVQMAEAYYQLGETAKADEMMKALADKAVEYLTWYLSLDDNRFMISTREFEYHWAVLDAEVKAMKKYNSKLAEIYEPKVEELYNMYVDRMKE